MPLNYIYTCFENGSPLQWEIGPDGRIQIGLLYDYEHASPNRAAGHWHFQLQAPAGEELTLVLANFDNIWNGRFGSPISERSNCFLSSDGKTWRAIPARKTADNRLEISLRMDSETLTLARLEPYRVSDLERLLTEIQPHPLVTILPIGATGEGRPLEIVRVGRPDADKRVLLRARSHPWEPGGNWLVQGLIRSLLEEDEVNRRYLERYCVYVLPMADKDGVVRGRTRFTIQGMDLNRNWEAPANPELAPENHALETWLEGLIAEGLPPQLALDLHNDNSGRLHISRPPNESDPHVAQMRRLEQLLRARTWFTEGVQFASEGQPWTFGQGLLERYGIQACILELNCDWIAGLQKVPFGADWELLGRQMRAVFWDYFDEDAPAR
jgi:hypothetical protein